MSDRLNAVNVISSAKYPIAIGELERAARSTDITFRSLSVSSNSTTEDSILTINSSPSTSSVLSFTTDSLSQWDILVDPTYNLIIEPSNSGVGKDAIVNTGNVGAFCVMGSDNEVCLQGSGTGVPVKLKSGGSDPDVSIQVIPKGFGEFLVPTITLISNDNAAATKKYVDDSVVSASGDVVGPAGATNNAVARFDTTTGKLLKNSVVLIDNSGNVTGVGNLSGTLTTASQPNVTGLGTLVSGVWNASTIQPDFGGTGLTTYTTGDLLYATGPSTLSSLADVAIGSVLKSGGVAALPVWGKVDLTSDVTGVLPVVNGGLGAASFTLGNVLVGNGAGSPTATKPAPSGDFVGTTDPQLFSNKSFSDAVSVGGVLTVTDATQSTSTANGALVVSGGAGIAKNLNVGGTTTLNDTVTVATGKVLSIDYTPTNATDAVNKSYVDTVGTGLVPKAAVAVATTAPLEASTYNNGVSGVGATITKNTTGAFPLIDTYSLLFGERILVKDEVSQLRNGIYTLTTVGDGLNPWVLTRATDMDSPASEFPGSYFYVQNGAVSGGSSYVCLNTSPPVVGTDPITFTQFSSAQSVVGSNLGAGEQVYAGNSGSTLTFRSLLGTTNRITTTQNANDITFDIGSDVALKSLALSQFASTTSAQLAGVISDETGTGSLVFSTSPTLNSPTMVTPTLGVATATSLNGLTITATTGTLTMGAASLLTMGAGASLAFTGSGSVVFGSGGTVVYTTGSQTLTGKTLTSNTNNLISRELWVGSGSSSVSTYASTAPSSGQVLTATSSTTATWQTPSTGSVTSVSVGNGLTLTGSPTTTPTLSLTSPVSPTLGGIGLTTCVTGDILYASALNTFATLAAAASGNTLLSGTTPSWGKVGLTTHVSGTLPATSGGTGLASYTTGDLVYANSATTLTQLGSASSGNALLSGVSAPSWGKIGLTTHVSGTLPATNGGTGLASYTTGDLVYANSATTLTRLPSAASGNVLLSGASAPSWGQIDLSTSVVTGVLPVARGGTGVTVTTGTAGSLVYSGSPTLVTPSIASIVNTGTLTLPTSTDTLVGRSTSDTLTGKTITSSLNNVTSRALFADSGATTVSVFAATAPSSGQVLTATSSTTATWQTPTTIQTAFASGTPTLGEANNLVFSGTVNLSDWSSTTASLARSSTTGSDSRLIADPRSKKSVISIDPSNNYGGKIVLHPGRYPSCHLFMRSTTELDKLPPNDGYNAPVYADTQVQSKLVPTGSGFILTGATGWFGKSIGMDYYGRTLVVGGPRDNSNVGAAWFYTRSLTGATFAQAGGSKKLGTGTVGTASSFGQSVAVSADNTTVVIGAPTDGTGATTNVGAAWIFNTSATQLAKLVGTGSSGGAITGERQGSFVSVSANGDTIAVSGDGRSVWMFYQSSPGVWAQQQRINYNPTSGIPSMVGATGGDWGSVALSSDGGTMVIGSLQPSGVQKLWIYERNGNPTAGVSWSQVDAFESNSGWRVAMSGDGNVILASDVGGGTANVYERNRLPYDTYTTDNGPYSWVQNIVTPNTSSPNGGLAITEDASTVVIGDTTNRGSYVFLRERSGLYALRGVQPFTSYAIVGTGNTGTSRQGNAIAMSGFGNVMVVGGYSDNTDVGATWVFK